MSKGRGWSAREDALLCAVYPLLGTAGALAVLAGRGKRGVWNRANMLGLRAPVRPSIAGEAGAARCAEAMARMIAALNGAVLPDVPHDERWDGASLSKPRRRTGEARADRISFQADPVEVEALPLPVMDRAEAPVRRAAVIQTRRRSFEEQLAAVRAGARLARAWRAPAAVDMRTLGGVSAGWGL